MERKAIMFITAAAASSIALSAAGCGGGSYSAAHPVYGFADNAKPGETKGRELTHLRRPVGSTLTGRQEARVR